MTRMILIASLIFGSFTLHAQVAGMNMQNMPDTQTYGGPNGMAPGNDVMTNILLQMAPTPSDTAPISATRAALRERLGWTGEASLAALRNFSSHYAAFEKVLNDSHGGTAGLPEAPDELSAIAVANKAAILKAQSDFRSKLAALVFATEKSGAEHAVSPAKMGVDSSSKTLGNVYVNTMMPNMVLYPGDIVFSPSRSTSLSIVGGDLQMRANCNGSSGVMWHTNTTNAEALHMQSDGNLALYGASQVLWETNTAYPGGSMEVEDCGKVIVETQEGAKVWGIEGASAGYANPYPVEAFDWVVNNIGYTTVILHVSDSSLNSHTSFSTTGTMNWPKVVSYCSLHPSACQSPSNTISWINKAKVGDTQYGSPAQQSVCPLCAFNATSVVTVPFRGSSLEELIMSLKMTSGIYGLLFSNEFGRSNSYR